VDEQLDHVFHALADVTRRRIIDRLAAGPLAVSDVAEPFELSLPAISKHLDVLERAGLVRRERDGRFIRCHLVAQPLDGARDFLDRYRDFWTHTLDGLASFVEREAAAPPRERRRPGSK
jgi:DNA-binding transcriptional ArsR family regulator